MAILRITARRDGFRRAGLAHPAVPVDHPRDRFTAEHLAALRAEPMLQVEEIEPRAMPPGDPDRYSAAAPAPRAARRPRKKD